jgi:hypothetical protein
MGMPSPHRRIGLVVDEPVDRALDLIRERAKEGVPEATAARQAVLEGALVEALLKLAMSDHADREQAADLIARVRELVPSLPLTAQIRLELLESLAPAQSRPSLAERRRRQLELLARPEVSEDAQTAQDLAETFDAFERLPSR